MRVSNLNVRFKNQVNPPLTYSCELTARPMDVRNVIPHIRMTQGAMKNIDTYDTIVAADITNAVKETAHGRLDACKDTNH